MTAPRASMVLPSKLRQALILKTHTGAHSPKWSIQRLAELNGSKLIEKKQIGSGISSETARILLQSVNVRLGQQYEKCVDMLNQLQFGHSLMSKQQQSSNQSIQRNGIIRAANNPNVRVSLTEQHYIMKEAKRLELKATKMLKDLQAVHVDTFQLTVDLMDNTRVLRRFSASDQSAVASVMEQIRSRHATTVETLADITTDLRKKTNLKRRLLQTTKCQFLSETLVNQFLQDRLIIQLLCDHYLGFNKKRPYGGISFEVPIEDVVSDAVTEMTHLCDANHGWCPPVEYHANNHNSQVSMTLIRPWAHHALGELLKNAMEATVQAFYRDPKKCHSISLEERQDHVYPVQIIVDPYYSISSFGIDHEYLAIHVVDHGIGFRNDDCRQRAFLFADSSFSDKDQRWDRLQDQQSYAAVRSPLSSLGVGLCLSRMMMQSFGGNVLLSQNQDAPGCTATILLNKDLTITEGSSEL